MIFKDTIIIFFVLVLVVEGRIFDLLRVICLPESLLLAAEVAIHIVLVLLLKVLHAAVMEGIHRVDQV